MAQIIRLIFRLDFEVSYSYLDQRGRALRALMKTVPDFWGTVGDGSFPNSYAANKISSTGSRTMTVESTNINGSIDWPSGVSLERLTAQDEFKGIDKILKALLPFFEVRILTRAGIRLVCVATGVGGAPPKRADILAQYLPPTFSSGVMAKYGVVEDVGLALEGHTEDKIHYRISVGPYAEKNALMFIPNIDKESLKLLAVNNLFFDIDLFEKDISFVEHSFFRWSSTKIESALNFTTLCTSLLRAKKEVAK